MQECYIPLESSRRAHSGEYGPICVPQSQALWACLIGSGIFLQTLHYSTEAALNSVYPDRWEVGT